VLRGVHPGFHDRLWGCQALSAPRDVLAHFEADPAAVDVARRSHPRQWGVPARAHVFEVVPEGHVLRVALRRRFDVGVIAQRGLAVAFAYLVHQALHRRADAVQVARVGHQGRIRAGVAGRGGVGRHSETRGGAADDHRQGSR
jgi:hypothetical protein